MPPYAAPTKLLHLASRLPSPHLNSCSLQKYALPQRLSLQKVCSIFVTGPSGALCIFQLRGIASTMTQNRTT